MLKGVTHSCLMANVIGLGKTLQSLGTLNMIRQDVLNDPGTHWLVSPYIIFVPLAAIRQWEDAIGDFLSWASVFVYIRTL